MVNLELYRANCEIKPLTNYYERVFSDTSVSAQVDQQSSVIPSLKIRSFATIPIMLQTRKVVSSVIQPVECSIRLLSMETQFLNAHFCSSHAQVFVFTL